MNNRFSRNEIRELSYLLYKEHREDKSRRLDVNKLLQSKNAQIKFVDTHEMKEKIENIQQENGADDYSGFLYSTIDDSSALKHEIYFDRDEAIQFEKRHRFTTAHEIAHIVLDVEPQILHGELQGKNLKRSFFPRKKINDYPAEEKEIEKRANFFAANLLVPRQAMIEMLLEFSDDGIITVEKSIELVTNFFAVSRSVAKLRIKDELNIDISRY